MMDTADFIRYYHGTILGEINGVFLVHYGNAEAVYYGIGSMVHNKKTGEEYPTFHGSDAANTFWAGLIEKLHAHPEMITEYVNPKYADDLIPLPLDETNLAALMQRIRTDHEDWKLLTMFPDFLIAKRTRQIHDDHWEIVTYREPGHFEGAPPLWSKTISKEDAEKYRRNLNEMYAYYQALKAEEEAYRREAAARSEQLKKDHPELFPAAQSERKRKKRILNKNRAVKHPHISSYERNQNTKQKGP